MTERTSVPDEPADPLGDGGLARIRLTLAYDGTDFSGWARQPDRRTVCGEVETALSTVLRTPIELTVAGRTDAGVHAAAQVAHADVPRGALGERGPDGLVGRLSRLLPADVRLIAAEHAPPEFDARFSALRRHYLYRVTDARYGALPHRSRETAAVRGPLDLEAMNVAAQGLLGLHDFAAYCRRREGATTVRTLERFEFTRVDGEDGHVLAARVGADAFCWQMVRSLVGAALAVGQGRRTVDWPASLLARRTRAESVPVAPAKGLTLLRVDYPADADLAARNAVTRDRRGPVETETAGAESAGDAPDCCE